MSLERKLEWTEHQVALISAITVKPTTLCHSYDGNKRRSNNNAAIM